MKFRNFISNLPPIVFHGTTAENGKQIEISKQIKPRGQSAGNWNGTFGGNPSNSDLVYCTLDKKSAIEYMKEICWNAKVSNGAVVNVKADWSKAFLDEDIVNHLLQNSTPQSNPKLWQAVASYYTDNFGSDPKDAYDIFKADVESEGESSDSAYAELIKDITSHYVKLLTIQELHKIIGETQIVAFDGTLSVVSVEFHNVGINNI